MSYFTTQYHFRTKCDDSLEQPKISLIWTFNRYLKNSIFIHKKQEAASITDLFRIFVLLT